MKSNIIKVLAIDPGLTNTGWSLLECDTVTGKIVVARVGEFHPAPTAEKSTYRDQVNKFSKRTISLKVLRESLQKLFVETKPRYVAIEDIFFNPTRPMAHAALAMWHCVARLAAHDVLNVPVEIVPTKIAKQSITGRGDNGKFSVQQSIITNKDISFKTGIEAQMDEHSADAIAVGYAFFTRNIDRINREFPS